MGRPTTEYGWGKHRPRKAWAIHARGHLGKRHKQTMRAAKGTTTGIQAKRPCGSGTQKKESRRTGHEQRATALRRPSQSPQRAMTCATAHEDSSREAAEEAPTRCSPRVSASTGQEVRMVHATDEAAWCRPRTPARRRVQLQARRQHHTTTPSHREGQKRTSAATAPKGYTAANPGNRRRRRRLRPRRANVHIARPRSPQVSPRHDSYT